MQEQRRSNTLTYADALTRHAQALAHMGALVEVVPFYTRAAQRVPTRFQEAPSPTQLQQAMAVVQEALRHLSTEDFRVATLHEA